MAIFQTAFYGKPVSDAHAEAVLRRCGELGHTLIDTAEGYVVKLPKASQGRLFHFSCQASTSLLYTCIYLIDASSFWIQTNRRRENDI